MNKLLWQYGFNAYYTILNPRDSRSAYGSVFRAARKGHVPGVMVSCMSVLRSGEYLQ